MVLTSGVRLKLEMPPRMSLGHSRISISGWCSSQGAKLKAAIASYLQGGPRAPGEAAWVGEFLIRNVGWGRGPRQACRVPCTGRFSCA